MACGAIVGAAFRQLVTVGRVDDPVGDGLAALRIDGRSDELVAWVAELPPAEWWAMVGEVERRVDALRRCWRRPDPAWVPRTRDTLRARISGAALELVTCVDLVLGVPGEDEASVALLGLTSGVRPHDEVVAELHFAALVEALRHPAPPFAVGLYDTNSGHLDVQWVTEELLGRAVDRTIVGLRRILELPAGPDHGVAVRKEAPGPGRPPANAGSGEGGLHPPTAGEVAA